LIRLTLSLLLHNNNRIIGEEHMVSIRRNYKILLFIAVAAMLASQAIVAGHDQFHNHISDDCVICKIAEVSSDKASLAQTISIVLPKLAGIEFFAVGLTSENKLWKTAQSRAPPAS
jgi:hypothetical protein